MWGCLRIFGTAVAAGDFYRQAATQLEPPEARELFQPFLKIEGGHQTLVQAELDSLAGTGFWFDVPEFRME